MTSPIDREQKQRDLDSILDAALDELDHSDSDEDYDAVPSASANPSSATENVGTATKQMFGPPPPPPSSHQPQLSLSAEEAELAASLEGMMQQFMNFNGDLNDGVVNGLQDAERAMEDMFRQMMMEETASTTAAAEKSKGNNSKESQVRQKKKKQPESISKQNSPDKMKPSKKETNNNMDQTINTLLNNIQQPAQPHNNPDPTTLADQTISSLLSDISHLTTSPDANPIIDTVMKQLLDKELMYSPMKEVCSRFPEWLARNKDNLEQKEYERYGKQYGYFQRICRVYETEPENFERLMELMQDIQEYGQPPVEIIKELAPELDFDEEGMPIMDPTGRTMGGGVGQFPPFMPGMPFPGGEGGGEQCCIS